MDVKKSACMVAAGSILMKKKDLLHRPQAKDYRRGMHTLLIGSSRQQVIGSLSFTRDVMSLGDTDLNTFSSIMFYLH